MLGDDLAGLLVDFDLGDDRGGGPCEAAEPDSAAVNDV